MKRLFVYILVLIVLSLLPSCFTVLPYETPYGIWKSDDPEIYLEITSQLQRESKGFYTLDGEKREVFLTFKNEPVFIVQHVDAYYYRESTNSWVCDTSINYFDGRFEARGDKLYYYARWSDLTGQSTGRDTRTIIFERVEEDDENDSH